MEDQNQDYSYVLVGETQLGSVSEDYFNPRPVKEENDEDNSCESDQDNAIDSESIASEFDTSEQAREGRFCEQNL